jgi:hypothetical protein
MHVNRQPKCSGTWTVDTQLDVMLDAAKSQYRAYDKVLRMVEQVDNEYDDEVQLAEGLGYGPRRETSCRCAETCRRSSKLREYLDRTNPAIQTLTGT